MTIDKRSFLKQLLSNPLVVLFSVVTLYYLVTVLAATVAVSLGVDLDKAGNVDLFWFATVRFVVFLGLVFAACYVLNIRPSAIGFSSPVKSWISKIIPAYLVYLIGAFIVMFIAQLFVDGFKIEETQNVGFTTSSAVWQTILVGLALVAMTPILEEVLFRGIFFKGLRRRLPFWISSLVVSLIFAAAHGQWNVALDTFILSLVACWLTEKTSSVWPAVVLHVVKNGLAFTLLFVAN